MDFNTDIEFMNFQELREKIDTENDLALFDEVVKCIKVEAYRSATIIIWISVAESLLNKLEQLSNNNHSLVNDLKKFKENGKNEAELLKLSKKMKLINDLECSELNIIRKARNEFAHPNYHSPPKSDVLSYLNFAVKNVLSRPSTHSYLYYKNLIENHLLKDPIFLAPFEENKIKQNLFELIKTMNANYFNPILELLFKLVSELFDNFDINKRNCRDIGLIFIKELLLYDNFIDNVDCNNLLNNYRKVSCNVFSEKEIWPKLNHDLQFRTFEYSIDFNNNIFSKVEFLNKFFELDESNILCPELKIKFNDFIDECDAEIILNSELSSELCYNKLMKGFSSYNWFIQNSVAKSLRHFNLNLFDESQLENLGRNLLQSADGGSWDCERLLTFYQFKNTDITLPKCFVQGLLFECFVNEKRKFRFKFKELNNVFKILDAHYNHHEILENLINLINESEFKNINQFYEYEKNLNRINEFEVKNINSNQINKLISSINKVACRCTHSILHDDLTIFNYKIPNLINHINCLNDSDKDYFYRLSLKNPIKLVRLFTKSTFNMNTKTVTDVKIEFDKINNIVPLNKLKIVIKDMNLNELTPREQGIVNYFLENTTDM